jgi:glycerol kinase
MMLIPMTPRIFVAIDQGGQSSRAIAYDERGRRLAGAAVPVSTRSPAAGQFEQDPDELETSIRSALDQIMHALPPDATVQAGLATQRSSIACWDRETGAALSPVISWRDTRNAGWLDSLDLDAHRVHRITGLRPSAHYGASKLRWCLDHLPEVANAQRSGTLAWGPLASFLVFRLTRERTLAADPVNASRTLVWDLSSADWSEELLELFGLPGAALPPVVTGDAGFGVIDVYGAPIRLCRCTGDQAAALYARGSPAADVAYVNAGTGAFVLQPAEHPEDEGRLLTSVTRGDRGGIRLALEGTVNGAASALESVARNLDVCGWIETLDAFDDRPVDPPLFLNGESGLGSPWWRNDFRSRFIGAGDSELRLLAVLESIAFMITTNLEICRQKAGPQVEIVITGGLGKSNPLCRRLASLNRLTVRRPAATEATARGLAWLLAERDDPWPESSGAELFQPRPDAGLAGRYAHWSDMMERSLNRDTV